MDADIKFRIISEGQTNGISDTCLKYNISRTLYYRWLNRYKAHGISGLEPITKQFKPVNKTPDEIIATTLSIIKAQPFLGPREVKYRLESIGHCISESAVYNIMKANQLTTRAERIEFARKRVKKAKKQTPAFELLRSGECWLLWATFYGHFSGIGNLYEYTILDYKSRIVCTRLYSQLDFSNFIDLLSAVAMPVGQSLGFETKHLCFLDQYKPKDKVTEMTLDKIRHLIHSGGYDITVHSQNDLINYKDFNTVREIYTHQCLSYLMPYIHMGLSFNDLKIKLQNHIREYNISYPQDFEGTQSSPLDYHIKTTNSKMILPLWAYIDREY